MTGPKAPWWASIYVVVPIFSGCVWLAMLLAMLLWWSVKNDSPHFPTMDVSQKIAYISDVASYGLQPLFIAMGSLSVVGFTTCFITERWLRHRGTIARNTSGFQKGLSVLAILFALFGMVGLIVLTCLNNRDHNTAHNVGLVVFIGGYILSSIFVCWEYQRLGIHYRQHRILRISFWVKLFFIFVELGLAIAFGVLGKRNHYDAAAVCEWVISLIFTFYVWSYAIDFVPAVRTQHYASKDTTAIDMAEGMEAEARVRGYPGGVQQEQAAYGAAGDQPMRDF